MADGVLSNVVGDIITKLGSRALDEIGLWWGVKGELKKLEATVSSIRNVLLDAEEKQKLNRQVKGWLERLEEVVYDADDLVDDFATEALRRRVMTGNRMTKELTSLQTLSHFVVAKRHIFSKDVGKINELNKLNNLRGRLVIRNLRCVDNEIVNVNLKEKTLLQSLELNWEDSNVDRDEMAFQNLQPHPNLKELHVYGYGGRRFPSWFSSLTNLVNLYISDANGCQHLPPMDQIPSLQYLQIVGLDDLEYMVIEGQPASFFPSLKNLTLHDCPKLKGWQKKRDDSTALELLQFPCLSYFSCDNCPNLTSIPQFPSLDESLDLEEVSPQLVHQIFTPSISSSSSILPPLSKLKLLSISHIEELESLPPDGLRNLTCLQTLSIGTCPALKCLPQELHSLTSLRRLYIKNCPQLKERCGNKKGVDWEFISHIQNIEVEGQTIQKEGRYLLDDEASINEG
ncbi:putative disease resistance protein RGA4 isoform X2 [Manihot esculenta]|uniref:putative disease resistance protein RGA4 isoform X2 n=1 Tax=Manihot esculenta TaxID=3983 RepID=UPI001CC4CFF0|nr:putative disease resistance protein RGA4 isoform X2 [Manihot esculenta]